MGEHGFHHRLAIIKTAINGNCMAAGHPDSRHLATLKIRDLAMRVHKKRINPFASLEGFQRRAAGIARSCPDDGQPLAALRQNMVHQAGKDLHSYILERQRRPVEQFQLPIVRPELHQWHHGGMMKGAISLVNHGAQSVVGDLAINKLCHHLKGNVRIRFATKISDLALGENRPCLGHIQPAISG